ncbi:MAG: hypothetical protein A2Y01_04490 [Omnitrophica WOR_2 bacterium GWC2_44_8]|nr:MAG: hypothetical protein A2Y01_04490 [Omnitrophica WOR_2 bacterium GWC2_44_8]
MRWCLNKNLRLRRKLSACAYGGFQLKFFIVLSYGIIFFRCSLCSAIENKTFDATVDFLKKDVSLSLNLQGGQVAKVQAKIEADTYDISLSLRHMRFGKSDLSTDFYSSGVITKAENGRIVAVKGKAWTQASLLNFKPLKEFFAAYELTPELLIINSLSWADFVLQGTVKRNPDNAVVRSGRFSDADLDLFLAVSGMDLKDMAGLLGVSPEVVALEGKAYGQVKVFGPHNAVRIEAKLTALDGKVSVIKFKNAKIDAEGFWPVLRFTDAQINDIGGVVYELRGKFNLRELSELNSAEHEVTVYCANNAVRFQDWVIRREHTIKGEDVVEAEYDLEKNQSLKMRIKDQEEIVGWEKTVKF